MVFQHKKLGGGRLEAAQVLSELTSSSSTPLAHQIQRLRNQLEIDYFDQENDHSLVVLGDFNFPRALFNQKSLPYQILAENLYDPFADQNLFSWPMPSSSWAKKPHLKMQIDHAFVSDKEIVQFADLLPFKGSDHAAIFLRINLTETGE